jgi:sugar/nucleoside kinase (ribokinase family)
MIPDVVVIGDINIDIITDPLAVDLAKQKEAEINTRFFLSLGGNAGNCSMALAKLGLQCRLIGALSNDPISKWLIEY